MGQKQERQMLNFEAVIFDLDGVITQTALVHARAWKQTFDLYLRNREEKLNETFVEFTHASDYLPFVDGKPRYEGVASFLESRKINLPYGTTEDIPEEESICGLGNLKNKIFNEILEKDGIKVYPGTIELIMDLKSRGIKIGLASSSKNSNKVLETAGILNLFQVRIDGVVSAELGLKGKPEPDIFRTACTQLNAEYSRSVVVEDAVSGVRAGSMGNFGLIIGVARENNEAELSANGADIVVKDLEEVSFESINNFFKPK